MSKKEQPQTQAIPSNRFHNCSKVGDPATMERVFENTASRRMRETLGESIRAYPRVSTTTSRAFFRKRTPSKLSTTVPITTFYSTRTREVTGEKNRLTQQRLSNGAQTNRSTSESSASRRRSRDAKTPVVTEYN